MKRSTAAELEANPATRSWQAVMAAPFGYVGIRTRDEQVNEVVYLGAQARRLNPVDAIAREATQSHGKPSAMIVAPVRAAAHA